MTFAALNLQLATGHGLWSRTTDVVADDWAAAEDVLSTQAQDFIANDPKGALVNGYHVFRNDLRKTLTLDLMRGG